MWPATGSGELDGWRAQVLMAGGNDGAGGSTGPNFVPLVWLVVHFRQHVRQSGGADPQAASR